MSKLTSRVCGLAALAFLGSACADVEGDVTGESSVTSQGGASSTYAPKEIDIDQQLANKAAALQDSALNGKGSITMPYGVSHFHNYVIPNGATVTFWTSIAGDWTGVDPVVSLFMRDDNGSSIDYSGTTTVPLDVLALNDDGFYRSLQSYVTWTNNKGYAVNAFLMVAGYGGRNGVVQVNSGDGTNYLVMTEAGALPVAVSANHIWTSNSVARWSDFPADPWLFAFSVTNGNNSAMNDERLVGGGHESNILNFVPDQYTWLFADSMNYVSGTTTINF